ncbi:MAG TPA: Fic family protein [Candidatus Elarobacter sp.]|nr:Fic family protein [Candidatus Elarobacter sp.]
MRRYIWELPGWPKLDVSLEDVLPEIELVREKQGAFRELLAFAGRHERDQALVEAAAATVVQTAAIEGETLDWDAVRSSVARHLGVDRGGVPQDDKTEGVVAMTLDATRNYERPLTDSRMFEWHAELFPRMLLEPRRDIVVGSWRDSASDPMRVLSGPIGRERIHFEAPPAIAVPHEMDRFIAWFNESRGRENGLIRAAIAHLRFLTVHPFEDGNGRIGRAIADMALSQDERSGDRFYSMSAQIHREKNKYYELLERTQQSTLDATGWVKWFIGCIARAIDASQHIAERTRRAAEFWNAYASTDFNERQRKVLRRMLGDFEGDFNLRKYIAISDAPRATAQRDLSDLVHRGILVSAGVGKATRYRIAATADRSAAS